MLSYILNRAAKSPDQFVSQTAFLSLTNGFSKKWENHWAAVALWFTFYNFCRIHESLRVTPAMAAGITDRVWTIGELLA